MTGCGAADNPEAATQAAPGLSSLIGSILSDLCWLVSELERGGAGETGTLLLSGSAMKI